MRELENFVYILTGNFDNKAQFDKMQAEGKTDFPFARHVNTVCNNKIKNMPEGFDGSFYPEGMEKVPRRVAIVRANRYMVWCRFCYSSFLHTKYKETNTSKEMSSIRLILA